MIEVVAAVSAATSAFNAIKKGFEVGRDIESMAGDMSRWMGAVSDIKKADEYNKKTTIVQKDFQRKFCRGRSDANIHGKEEGRGYEKSTQADYYFNKGYVCMGRALTNRG